MFGTESLPTIFPLLKERRLVLAMLGAFALVLVTFNSGVFGWPCPFLALFGLPCPGCGLTRATSLLLQGQIRSSLQFHAFAPVMLLGLIIAGTAAVLPERARQPWIDRLIWIEQRTALGLFLIAALMLYWLARLVFQSSAFVQLIRG